MQTILIFFAVHDFSGGEINRFVRNEMIDIIAVKLSDMIKE